MPPTKILESPATFSSSLSTGLKGVARAGAVLPQRRFPLETRHQRLEFGAVAQSGKFGFVRHSVTKRQYFQIRGVLQGRHRLVGISPECFVPCTGIERVRPARKRGDVDVARQILENGSRLAIGVPVGHARWRRIRRESRSAGVSAHIALERKQAETSAINHLIETSSIVSNIFAQVRDWR